MSWFVKKRIYMDYASAPPVLAEADAAVARASKLVGNPGAIHREAVEAKKSLEDARERIARVLSVKTREVVFTSGLTESNNLSILGYAKYLERTKRTLSGTHWIVSSIEHASVLECFSEVERMGGEVTHVEPDERGIVSSAAVLAVVKKETVFVSIGWANNELGTIQPLREISLALKSYGEKNDNEIIFHSDAGQAPLYLSTTVHSLGVHLLSLGSNKLYGPHGIGALFISAGTELAPLLSGGKQERGLRAGTENVALAAGFAAAFKIIAGEREKEAARLIALRDSFAENSVNEIPGLIVNGDLKHSLPHMLNISIPDISSEYVTLALDHAGIAVSTKSACREGEESSSHAVAALGGEVWRARNTLRFSLGRDIQPADIPRVVHALRDILKR